MTLFDRLAGLPVTVERYALERLEMPTPRFTRVSTVVRMHGKGVDGVGEDVSYVPADQEALHALPELPLTGSGTFADLSARVDALDLFPAGPPEQPAATDYRRWAFESALLDLALRQAGTSLGAALGLPYAPVRFVVSGGRPEAWLEIDPHLEFKVDSDAGWDEAAMAALAATGRVRTVDLKDYYVGDFHQIPADQPAHYARVIAAFGDDVVLEDGALTPETLPVLQPVAHRLSFDAPIHSLADLTGLAVAPGWCNIKPSRFGTAQRLLETIEHCQAEGIRLYGGGQFELGPGRSQIQAFASLFYADGPNDVAPGGYNAPEPVRGLPSSPLHPSPFPVGLGL